MRVALIGCSGYWGQKLQRVLEERGHFITGIDKHNLDCLEYTRAEAAFIATPPDTHYSLAMRAMKAGMDVLVEKPMALKTSHACAMTDYAKENGVVLSVDSTFLHTDAAKFFLDLGQPLVSYQSIRLAPPMPQAKINAAWDLLVHDISILQRLSGAIVPGVGAVDGSVATAAIPLQSGGSAFMMGSRCWTHKVREIVLHYPKGTFLWKLDGVYSPDGWSLVSETQEPLQRLVMDFERRCQERRIEGLTDGTHGAEVVGCLERLFPNHSTIEARPRRVGNGLHRQGAMQPLQV